MRKDYWQIVVLTLVYDIVYFLSLVFATGYGIGIKCDDNQLIGYVLVIVTLLICLVSFKVKDTMYQKNVIKVMGVLIALFLILFFSGIVGSNEAMFLFIIPIIVIPIFIYMCMFHYLCFY
ncbi:MAG: hypothetical protein RR968_01310 [Vagococcus sp.]